MVTYFDENDAKEDKYIYIYIYIYVCVCVCVLSVYLTQKKDDCIF